MTDTVALDREQLAGEAAHWRAAIEGLADLDNVAAPAAWAAIEEYLQANVRGRLREVAESIAREAQQLAADVPTAREAADVARLRSRLLLLRVRYLKAETVIDFYGDAVNTRTSPRVAALLRGLDTLAVDSMQALLRPLGINAPEALVYIDRGLGASILRAGVRLWDQGSPSPAAAIKITRHNLLRPTSLAHETGHQVAHLTQWNAELADALDDVMAPVSREAAAAWRLWSSEVAGDVYAFALLGYGPVPALANVVDGTTAAVYRVVPGDPHPFALLRVLFNAALCRRWYGAGPWNALAASWLARHPVERAPAHVRALTTASLPMLDVLADVCTRSPMRAFGGRPLSALVDPRRVSPSELEALATRAGPSLYTSKHLQRNESMRILAWLMLQAARPRRTVEATRRFESWLIDLGGVPLAATA